MPHAGWIYSGRPAGLALAALVADRPETVVVFGATHVLDNNEASVFPSGEWETPIGRIAVDHELAERVTISRWIQADPNVHAYEHSIEVGVPFIQTLMPQAKLLPIMVRPGPRAAEVGGTVAVAARDLGRRVAFIGSTDLTHYGPAFGFEPHGRGEQGVRWAKEVNDRRMVDLIAAFRADEIVPEAALSRNACGAGAVAATIAAAQVLGATRYVELLHTTSAEVEGRSGGRPVNSVGYEAGVFV